MGTDGTLGTYKKAVIFSACVISGTIAGLCIGNFKGRSEDLVDLLSEIESSPILPLYTSCSILSCLVNKFDQIKYDWSIHQLNQNFSTPLATLLDSITGIVVGGGVLWIIAKLYEVIRKQEGLGLGDVKLMAMIGAFLGWRAIFFVFLFSSLFASILGIFLMIFSRYKLHSALPYGPFIVLGALLYLFSGTEVLHFYFDLVHHLLH